MGLSKFQIIIMFNSDIFCRRKVDKTNQILLKTWIKTDFLKNLQKPTIIELEGR